MKKLPPYQPKQVEEEILNTWHKEKTFEQSLEKTKDGKPFSFYDGPPFANGLPHFGHSLVTSIKDSIGRYQTMRGRYVARRNGWDCHGLPVEFEIEKKFNVSGKKQIMELGLEKFNQACRDSVFTYKKEWEDFFDRIGRWTDTEHAYATIDNSYIESVWWVFSQIYQKGLIYQGYKSMPYCPRCATPLSNFEVNEGYKDDVSDPSLFVKFQLVDDERQLLAWTTTPWSLPGNAALAVKPTAKYVTLLVDGQKLVVTKDRIAELSLDTYEVLDEYDANELVGKHYQPVFELQTDLINTNTYQVWADDMVSIEEGTGVLHVAPAFGEDDLNLGQQHDIPVLQTVAADGSIATGWGLADIEGKFFKQADKLIIERLSETDRVFAAETLTHTYPFCYRCDTPLLYYAISTWFVAVSQIKDDLLKTAASTEWTPQNIKTGRFGKWLEGARDWAISRNRYWGAPVPIWVNEQDADDILVVSSIEQLRELAVGNPKLDDLHRPFIDDVVIEQDGKTYRRVEEVIDCWFESGSMPYAQVHYPFEHKAEFENSFPADYIGEGLDQTRLWFYVLHVIATIVQQQPAYKHVLVNGMIMAADGRKLSKRLKNYPPLEDVFADEGADSLRYYLLSSQPAVSADYMRFDRSALRDIHRNLFMTLYNSASFMSMYARIDGWQPAGLEQPSELNNPLDRWIVARVHQTIKTATEAADNFELAKASWPVYELVDDLSNWYIRRSRRRFWKSDDDSDKQEAYATLFWTLISICQLLAPWAPFVSDWLYRHLTADLDDAPSSVHLSDWPVASTVDQTILGQMEQVRTAVNEGLAQRMSAAIKVRQPLGSLELSAPVPLDQALLDIIADEVNVKKITTSSATELSVQLDTTLTDELRAEGLARELIRHIQQGRKQAGLEVENHIELSLSVAKAQADQLRAFEQLIAQETLADRVSWDKPVETAYHKTATIDGDEFIIGIQKSPSS